MVDTRAGLWVPIGVALATLLVTMAVWIGIPIAVGWARIGRGDVA